MLTWTIFPPFYRAAGPWSCRGAPRRFLGCVSSAEHGVFLRLSECMRWCQSSWGLCLSGVCSVRLSAWANLTLPTLQLDGESAMCSAELDYDLSSSAVSVEDADGPVTSYTQGMAISTVVEGFVSILECCYYIIITIFLFIFLLFSFLSLKLKLLLLVYI